MLMPRIFRTFTRKSNHIMNQWNELGSSDEHQEAVGKLVAELKIHPVLAEMLTRRDIHTVEEAKTFFKPHLLQLHDPFLMKDMDKAVARLNQAMGNKEEILIYGDYDVDGTTAVALVYTFIQQYYSGLHYYIPDRTDEGYGLTELGIDLAAEKGVSLIIVLDCGVKAVKEVQYAREKGIDVIVCDHHMQDDELPDAVAILNPKRLDNTYPCAHLSGCGVGFKFMQAFALSNNIEFHHLIPLLDLVAVSIAADIVPTLGENRILAYHGLRQLNSNPRVGLKAIIDLVGLNGKDISMSDIVFKIGPRINASGRMMCGRESVELLIQKDYKLAVEQCKQIDCYNEMRKDLDKATTEEATIQVKEVEGWEDKHSVVIYNESWHKGVVGIVASRLTEVYHRPTIVLTKTGEFATGSARSVPGFDIYNAVASCRDLLETFGGHTYAVGLSMNPDNMDAFSRRLEEYVAAHIDDEQHASILNIEATIDFRTISKKFFKDLKKFSPFGPGNPKPLFRTKQCYDYGTSKVVGRDQAHIKLELVDNISHNVVNGIAFGQSDQARYIKSKRAFDIVYSIQENSHKPGEIQLQIQDIKPTILDE